MAMHVLPRCSTWSLQKGLYRPRVIWFPFLWRWVKATTTITRVGQLPCFPCMVLENSKLFLAEEISLGMSFSFGDQPARWLVATAKILVVEPCPPVITIPRSGDAHRLWHLGEKDKPSVINPWSRNQRMKQQLKWLPPIVAAKIVKKWHQVLTILTILKPPAVTSPPLNLPTSPTSTPALHPLRHQRDLASEVPCSSRRSMGPDTERGWMIRRINDWVWMEWFQCSELH